MHKPGKSIKVLRAENVEFVLLRNEFCHETMLTEAIISKCNAGLTLWSIRYCPNFGSLTAKDAKDSQRSRRKANRNENATNARNYLPPSLHSAIV